ncbi:MAG: FMN-binding protein [Spongiibacteraceae bacterium]|nr:FMN-binding protein [Spongiibacteraceae bacterium]MBN51749.1 FMN-binding protein [Spongiibacteraceae bacterium]|tara:strand:- start:1748 stop:2221 length:474 start_codon:yes stop_codon:yes gene_type:complete
MARGTYLTVPEFVSSTFRGSEPPLKTLWLSGELQQRLHKVFGHPYKSLRLRYWQQDAKSAWVLEEIGKELPITLGVVVNGASIEQIRILTYRESRGGEVRHPFFTEQFEGAQLGADDTLDRQIDGITGATLSVRAVTRVAEAALVLAAAVADKDAVQ